MTCFFITYHAFLCLILSRLKCLHGALQWKEQTCLDLFWKEVPDTMFTPILTNLSLCSLTNQIWGGGALTDHSYFFCKILSVWRLRVVSSPAKLSVFFYHFSVQEYQSDASPWPTAYRGRAGPAVTTLYPTSSSLQEDISLLFSVGLKKTLFCVL